MSLNARLEKSVDRFARHPWWILFLALVLSGASIWSISRLDVLTSRQALLPKDAGVFQRLQSFLDTFGAASDLIVVLEGAEQSVLEDFADKLAQSLRTQPEVGQASAHLDPQFFFEHAYLLIPPGSLDRFSEVMNILEGIDVPTESPGLDETLEKAESWLDDPPPLSGIDINLGTAEGSLELLSFFLEEWRRWLDASDPPVAIDWSRLLSRHGGNGLERGYFVSRDGKMLFVFVRSKSSSEEFSVLAPFIARVRSVADSLRQSLLSKGEPAPTFALTGLPAVVYEEYTTIQHDIRLVILTAAGLVLLLILVALRSLRLALTIFVPMGLGVLWSSGLILLTIGHLSIITSGFTAILFGLGVDYGIFTSSRIREERLAGRPLLEAIRVGMVSASKAILTAGGATVLIFCSLATVDFPGFSELGLVAGSGVLLVLVSTFLVQPALMALWPPPLPKQAPSVRPAPDRAGRPKRALPRALVATTIAVSLVAASLGALAGFSIPFDYDVLSMLPKDSEAARYQRRMVAESDYQGEVVIFTASSVAEARRLSAAAEKLGSLARVQSITSLFPEDAEARADKAQKIGRIVGRSAYVAKALGIERLDLPAKLFDRLRSIAVKSIAVLDEAQELAFSAGHSKAVKAIEDTRSQMEKISKKLTEEPERAHLRTERYLGTLFASAQHGLEVLKTWQVARPLTPDQIPADLRDRFFSSDGRMALYGFPSQSVYDPPSLDRLMKEVYSVSNEATGFPTTHQVFSRMVVSSFIQGTVLAVILALLWILLVLRSWRGFLIAGLPLLVGGGWMFGILALLGIPYNYANMIALPLVMGLAVDYGVWFGHRRRELSELSAVQVALVAGKAILLAAGTTLAGLGAITLARYQGVSTMGVAITVGLCCCLTAALFVAPALTQLFYRRNP